MKTGGGVCLTIRQGHDVTYLHIRGREPERVFRIEKGGQERHEF